MQCYVNRVSKRHKGCDLVTLARDDNKPVTLGYDSVGSYPSHIMPGLYLKPTGRQVHICWDDISVRLKRGVCFDASSDPLSDV